MEILINALLTVAIVVALGWVAGKTKIIKQEQDHGFSTFLLKFSLPILLFNATATAKPQQLLDLKMNGAFIIGLMGMYLIVFILNKFILHRSIHRSAETAFVCGYPNTAFIGIPLMSALVGSQAMPPIVVSNIIVGIFMIPLTLVFIEIGILGEDKVQLKPLLLKMLINPLIVLPLIGIIISVLGIQLPKLVISSATMIGSTTPGVSLFTLGLIMSRFKIQLSSVAGINIFMKNILHPILMIGIVKLFGITGLLAKELIILCAMPTAITSTIFSVSFDIDPLENVSSTILGTIVSLITLLGFMYWLKI